MKADFKPILQAPNQAFISRYALGRDYHKVMRKKLQKLCDNIQAALVNDVADAFEYRVFTDSAPVLEVAIAEKSGLGWRGKHTLLINKDRGSWFFLGEIYTNLPLIIDAPASNHCGTCTSCIEAVLSLIHICPLNATEVRQIAGRAGRFGIYDIGYVSVLENDERIHLSLIHI